MESGDPFLLRRDRSAYLLTHDALKDFETGIVYSNADLVCNLTPIEDIVPMLYCTTLDWTDERFHSDWKGAGCGRSSSNCM